MSSQHLDPSDSAPPHDAAPRRALLLAHGRDRGAVTAARALAVAGWRVDVGSSDPAGGLVGSSRAVDRVFEIPRPRGTGEAFVAGVRAAHAAGGHQLLFGCGDDWMAAAVHHRDELPIRLAHPETAAVQRAADKLELHRLASDAGLPALDTRPAHEVIVNGQVRLPEGWGYPVVVKNRHHWRPQLRRALRTETRLSTSPERLLEHVQTSLEEGDEPVLQRHVTGRLGALIGLMHEGRLIGRVQQTSPRLWPTPAGASARAITVPVDEDLAARTETLLNSLGWSGLVELQFLTDDDGTPWLIDLNGRFFGSLALSETARPGLVGAWAETALGRPVPPLEDGIPHQRYQWLPGDLRRALIERRRGLVRDLGSTLRWAATATHSVGSLSDLGPTRELLGGWIRSAAQRVPIRSRAAGAPSAR